MAVKGPNHQMRTRIRGLTVLFALIGFGLVGVRLLYMQVFNHDFYVQQATALQTRDTFITPNRGKIYDANMQVLAESAAVEQTFQCAFRRICCCKKTNCDCSPDTI